MINKIQQYATGKNLLFAAVVFLSGYLFLNTLHHPVSILTIKQLSGGHTILNLLPFYNAAIGYEYIESYTSEAVNIYKRVLIFDVIILIPAYVVFFILSFCYYGWKILPDKKRIISIFFILPIIAALLNLVEDGIIRFLLESQSYHSNKLMTIAGIITTSKLLIFAVCFFLITVCFIISLFQKERYSQNTL